MQITRFCSLFITIQRFLKKLKIDITYDPVSSLWGIYPKKMRTLIQKNICTPTFIAALFTLAKIQKQPGCPSLDDWIKRVWFIYTVEYYAAIENEILPFMTTYMNLVSIMLREISQAEKDKHCMVSL